MHSHHRADDLPTQIVLFRVRDYSVHFVNSVEPLRDVDHEAHIEKQQGRGEKQAVQQIERAANSWEQIARVFYTGAALDNGFGQIAEDRSKPKQQTEHRRMCPVEH